MVRNATDASGRHFFVHDLERMRCVACDEMGFARLESAGLITTFDGYMEDTQIKMTPIQCYNCGLLLMVGFEHVEKV